MRAWDRLEVGGVVIGDVPSFRVDNMPYGGVKDSGLGREGVRCAIEDMTEIEQVLSRASSLPPVLDFVGASLLATNEFRTCSEFPQGKGGSVEALECVRREIQARRLPAKQFAHQQSGHGRHADA
jgi:hypothetical protein